MASSPNLDLVEIVNLSKQFGGTHALRQITLTLKAGEVHGLLGHNGSGKSTLIKILAGYHAPDPGSQLRVRGRTVALPVDPSEIQRLGIAFVHQDLGLALGSTVLENFMMTVWATHATWAINWRKQARTATAWFSRFGVQLDPSTLVADLPPWDRALLAVLRALRDMTIGSGGIEASADDPNGLLVLDEATAFLPPEGRQQLVDLIHEVTNGGSGVLFVSHDLDEVLSLTDRITVLRDGALVGTVNTADVNRTQLVEMIVGSPLGDVVVTDHHGSDPNQSVYLEVENARGVKVRDLSLTATRGECVGLTGILGSGYEEVPYLLFGALSGRGRIRLDADTYGLETFNPVKARAAGIALVPADRGAEGGVAELPVADNVTLAAISRFQRRGILRRRAVKSHADRLVQQYQVRPQDAAMAFHELSGGNQQKVVLAKWLDISPRFLILDEPTKGVDVAAREQIFQLIGDVRSQGGTILCVSGDHEQLAAICDRVLIMRQGRVIQQVGGSAISKDTIAQACYGSEAGLDEGVDDATPARR